MKKQEIVHSFNIEDVEKYGSIEKALIVKEIRNIAIYKIRNRKEGWVYYSGQALSEKFTYMNPRSIRRWLKELEDDGHIKSEVRNKYKYDTTKSFLLTELSEVEDTTKNDTPVGQSSQRAGQSSQTRPSLSSSLSTKEYIAENENETFSSPRDEALKTSEEKEILLKKKAEEERKKKEREEKKKVAAEKRKNFNPKEAIEKMATGQKHIKVIYWYWKFKEFEFENYEQYQSALKRELRAAKALVGYSEDRILEVMDYLHSENDFKWTLETVHKYIDEDPASFMPIKKNSY